MSRVHTMSRFEEPGNEPEAYECEKCYEIKDASEFKDSNSLICLECEEEE